MVVTPRSIANQDALAAVDADGPTWARALRQPDPGVALSPHIFGGTPVAVGPGPALSHKGKGARLGGADRGVERALYSPINGLLATANANQLPWVSFVPVPVPSARPDRLAQRDPSTTAAAALTSMLSAYLPERADIEAPFDLLLAPEKDGEERPHGVSGGGRDHWWSDRPLPKDVASKKSLRCLTEAVYFEARGESELGQRAVAQVVLNRVKNPDYPDDVCGVVFQNKSWRNRCQFTFACDGIKDRVNNPFAWAKAKRIAKAFASGEDWLDEVGAATHYHAKRVNPRWARLMRRVKSIDKHIFYITKGGGWT
ncbi:MAG: cell wall hydrolase [Pseudomonadota bacterium]